VIDLGDYVPIIILIIGAFVIFFLGYITGRTQAGSKDR